MKMVHVNAPLVCSILYIKPIVFYLLYLNRICCPQAHEVLSLEMLTLLLERPTDDSVEVSIAFLKECGLKLTEVSPRGINGTGTIASGRN